MDGRLLYMHKCAKRILLLVSNIRCTCKVYYARHTCMTVSVCAWALAPVSMCVCSCWWCGVCGLSACMQCSAWHGRCSPSHGWKPRHSIQSHSYCDNQWMCFWIASIQHIVVIRCLRRFSAYFLLLLVDHPFWLRTILTFSILASI